MYMTLTVSIGLESRNGMLSGIEKEGSSRDSRRAAYIKEERPFLAS
jgi:hypothetical protein